MRPTNKTNLFTGRAKAALVFEGEMGPTAFITPIVARVCSDTGKNPLSFSGPAIFSKKTVKQIETVVWPLANQILRLLKISIDGLEISVTNPGIASMWNVGTEISGYSTDVPVFLANLSAALKMSVNEKIAFTGHIASTDGTIGLVKAIPAKLEAAINDPSIETFVYPDIDREHSMTDLAPQTKQRIEGALAQAKNHVTLIGVRDIADLVRVAFPDAQVVMASLNAGFFGVQIQNSETDTIIEQTAKHFTDNLNDRFWQVLSACLSRGKSSEGSMLLSAFVKFHLWKNIYPHGIGRKLFQVVASLPPATRRIKIKFPLVSMAACIELGQHAKGSENKDVLLLLKACSGDGVLSKQPDQDISFKAQDSQNDGVLETILFEIGADNLTMQVAKPINQARATYVMETVVAPHEDFNEIIASFSLHLLRHTRSIVDPVDMDAVGAEGLALLERAFAKKGGFQGALAEARYATNGGVRFVLDSLTQKFIQEQQEKYIGRVLKTAMDPLDWDSKVKLMKAIIRRLKAYLPAAIASQPAERFTVQYEQIVRAYSQSLDQIKSVFRLF